MTDYKTLLKKYMCLVVDCEGVTFVSRANDKHTYVEFDDEEIAELEKIEGEL